LCLGWLKKICCWNSVARRKQKKEGGRISEGEFVGGSREGKNKKQGESKTREKLAKIRTKRGQQRSPPRAKIKEKKKPGTTDVLQQVGGGGG